MSGQANASGGNRSRYAAAVRICYFTPVFLPDLGGAEVVSARLSRGLHESGHDVHVLTRGRPAPLDVPHPVTWYPKMHRPHWRPERVIKHLRRLHARERFDVFLVNYGRPTGVAAVRLSAETGVPTVLVSHGGDLHPRGEDRARPHVFRRTEEAYRRADACVAISAAIETLIKEIRGHDRPTVRIPNGVDADDLNRPADPPADVDPERPFVLALGNLRSAKGFGDAIAALARPPAAADAGHLALYLVGRGEREAEWRALAARHGLSDRVRFLGVRTGADKRWLLRHCRFGLMPSVEEGHPVVGLEYLATGRPVVCTTLGAFDDMCVQGVNAWRVPPRDPDALAHAIAEAAALPAGRAADIDRFSRARAADFAWPRITARYLEVLRAVVEAPRR